jgi:hypothetical protein
MASPFLFDQSNKIPVSYGAEEAGKALEDYSDKDFCFYLADKNLQGWERSTSRVYMNELWPSFLYLPVNVEKDNIRGLEEVYELAISNKRVIAVNHTVPHKSNKALLQKFPSLSAIDTLVRDSSDKELQPFNLNEAAFFSWLDEVYPPKEREEASVIIIGVGGVGLPIASKIALSQGSATSLSLIDPKPLSDFPPLLKQKATSIGLAIEQIIGDLRSFPKRILVISASGKEGIEIKGLKELFVHRQGKGDFFVDLRPHLELDTVISALSLGWEAYTGEPMNARNDFALVEKIASALNLSLPSFSSFEEKVIKAS